MMEHISSDKIHDLLDGLLPATEEAEIEAHLERCHACRNEVAELQDLVSAMRRLPASAELPEDAWQGIASRIEGRTPGREEDVRVVAFPGAVAGRRRFHFTVPQLAAAAVVVSLLSAGVVWTALDGGRVTDGVAPVAGAPAASAVQPASMGGAEYAAAVAELEAMVAEGRSLLSPETVATLDDALRTIDGALEEVRVALEADPSSRILGRMLANHQRSRLRLLRQAAAAVQAVS